jgi:sulfur-carrier protein adenylyltransferase/sulfurtransferase
VTVTFRIPGPLLSFTGGRQTVEAEAAVATVEEALAQLWRLYPGLRDRILTEQGQVRPHVNVFVGADSIRDTGGLATPIGERAEIAIIPAVSGGVGGS